MKINCYNYKCNERENCKEVISRIICFKRVNKEQAELMRRIDKTRHPRFCNHCLKSMVRGKYKGRKVYVCTSCKGIFNRGGKVRNA